MHLTTPKTSAAVVDADTQKLPAVVCGCVSVCGRLPAPARVFISLDLMTANGYASNKTLLSIGTASLLDKRITPPLHLTPPPRPARMALELASFAIHERECRGASQRRTLVEPDGEVAALHCVEARPAARSKTSHLPRNVFTELSIGQKLGVSHSVRGRRCGATGGKRRLVARSQGRVGPPPPQLTQGVAGPNPVPSPSSDVPGKALYCPHYCSHHLT